MRGLVFASVGSMLPFDRFVKAVDEWARDNSGTEVLIQIGDGAYEPRFAPWTRIMPPAEYRANLDCCALFVAHVGMGSILQGLEAKKQMLLMPRRAEWREHTTDHQLHTAAKFRATQGLVIEEDEERLKAKITHLLANPLAGSADLSPYAPEQFTNSIAAFLRG
jgi:UDP-N-acetylglucosamine transferase subunit ALG13